MGRILMPSRKLVREINETYRRLEEGLYHGLIVDGYPDEKDGTEIFECETLAGTMRNCTGIKQKFYFRDDERGTIKLAKFCIAAGVLSAEEITKAAEDGRAIEFEPLLDCAIGSQICFRLRKSTYLDNLGERITITYSDFFHVDSPEAINIPKDEKKLRVWHQQLEDVY